MGKVAQSMDVSVTHEVQKNDGEHQKRIDLQKVLLVLRHSTSVFGWGMIEGEAAGGGGRTDDRLVGLSGGVS